MEAFLEIPSIIEEADPYPLNERKRGTLSSQGAKTNAFVRGFGFAWRKRIQLRDAISYAVACEGGGHIPYHYFNRADTLKIVGKWNARYPESSRLSGDDVRRAVDFAFDVVKASARFR